MARNRQVYFVIDLANTTLERFKKNCSHPVEWRTKPGLLPFGFVSAQSQGFQTFSFAKASPKGKTPGSERLQFFLNRSPMRVNVNAEVKNIWACPCEAQRSEAESRALALALAPIRCARLGGGFK
jgi:hypothetical protein